MKRYDYFKYAMSKEYYMDLSWLYLCFGVLSSKMTPTKYLKYEDGFRVDIDGQWLELDNAVDNLPLFTMLDNIEVTKDMISNIKSNTTSTIGRFLANKILLEYPLGNTIEYINSNISVGKLEDIIASGLLSGEIKVDQYVKFVDSVNYMKNLSRMVSVSATPKNILPPAGLDKFKKDKMREYDEKYGKEWKQNRLRVLEFKEELKNYDKEWLKDDPSYGKLTSGKIVNNARVKMYLTFGDEVGFDNTGKTFQFVENSLMEGYPKDKEKLAAMYNSSRSGSYDRGKETQKGGIAAKQILRSTSSLNIVDGDCGSKKGKVYIVTNELLESIKGRYIISGNKVELIEDPSKYLGKNIVMRSPMYCLSKGGTFCSVCMGKVMSNYKSGLSLATLNVSSKILGSSLKRMHDTQVKTVNIDMGECLS